MAAQDPQTLVAELAASHGPQLRRFLLARVRNAADLPDIVQDVYLRMLRIPHVESIRSPEAAFPGWQNVRLGEAANMATGLGNGTIGRNPNNILDGGLENYATWYEAHSKEQKIQAALTGAKPFPWGPGQVARYRDQDMFLLGVAMDNYVKKKVGATASVWTMLSKEVFERIGIYDAPINKTLEPQGVDGQPLMAFGFYPTMRDIVRIARLYQNLGAFQDRQLLYAPQIRKIFSRSSVPGLPTGQHSPSGESYYALFPGKVTGIRIAKITEDDTGAASATFGMATVADHLANFCP